MFQKFTSKKGNVYVKSTDYITTVDEMIAFLEQYRGMQFYVGATEHLAFLISNGFVSCDDCSYVMSRAYEESMHLEEMLCDFFDTDDECGAEEDWRKRYDYDDYDE